MMPSIHSMPMQQNQMMWNRLFQISNDRKLSYQRQLREMIVSAILDDKLPLDIALPSSRELARHLGIARNTVVLAYQQLIDEGYLVSRERSGYFIDKTMLNGRVRVEPLKPKHSNSAPDWSRLIKFHPSQQRNIVKPPDWKKYPYPFLFGQLDPGLFPVADWRECCRQALSVSDIQDVTPDRIDIDDPLLIEQIQARILPRGGVWALHRREAMLRAAEENDFLVVEDDYESEINFIGEPTPALKSLDGSDRVIYVGSLSKTLAPGLRVGYMVASKELIEEARALRRLMVRHPPANNQRIVALFLSMGHHDSLIHRLSETYQDRWQVMGEALNRHLPDSSRIPSFGGTSYWVKGADKLDTRLLKEEARKAGILIESGDICFMQENPPQNFLRLGYSSIGASQIEPGIKKLSKLIHQMS